MTEIKIYSTPSCPYCNMAKEFFIKNDIKFTNIDVSTDAKKAQEMIDKSGQMGVPVIVVKKDDKENVVVGFDEPGLSKLLELK